MARSRSSLRLRKGCLKLVFFALTFVVFVSLQNLLQYVEPTWLAIRREMSGIPWWMLTLAFAGLAPIVWIIILGVDQLLRRLCNTRRSSYETISSDEDSDDVESGPAHYPKRHTKAARPKRSKNTRDKMPHDNRSAPQRSQAADSDENSNENPTDVDVTVHPVDTTIAAGGEARISPSYNVALMNFTAEKPTTSQLEKATSKLYPTAPSVQGGPAFFQRQF